MPDFPKRLQIETFLGCNAACTMCSVQDWQREHGEMEDDVFLQILEESKPFQNHLEVVSLTMDGEPLMGRKIARRVVQCQESGLFNIGFATNGSLMKKKKTRELLDAGLDWISFSFDTLDASVFEKVRVNLKHDIVKDNIINFINVRDRGNYKTKINVRFLGHAIDSSGFEEYRRFWSGMVSDGDEIHFGEAYDWYSGKKSDFKERVSCSYVFDNLVILRDGTVPLCCRDYNATFVYGNIMETSLINIWNSQFFCKVRRWHAEGRGGQIDLCAGCDMPSYESARAMISSN